MEAAIARHRSLLVLCSVLSLLAGGIVGFFTPHPRGQPITVVLPEPTPTPSPTPTPGPLRVYVSGAVAAPGVYRLPSGSLVEEAVRAAGGPDPNADLEVINLAQELQDQQHVRVLLVSESACLPTPTPQPAISSSAPRPININTATGAELESLPHVGPSIAQRIVAHREAHGPFESIEGLLDVPGIGPATFEKLRTHITIGD
jgi:competence protein ComEA